MYIRRSFFMFVAGWLLSAPHAFAQTEGFTGPGRYRIDSVASGKSLDVKAEDKPTVQQWAGSGAPNQQWDIEDARDGYFYLRSVETNKVLDFAENRVRDGIALIVADQRDSDNQKWKIADTGNNQFTLVSKSGKVANARLARLGKSAFPFLPLGRFARGGSACARTQHARTRRFARA
jgi:hypothetical protein